MSLKFAAMNYDQWVRVTVKVRVMGLELRVMGYGCQVTTYELWNRLRRIRARAM